jgi:hypothetical protein
VKKRAINDIIGNIATAPAMYGQLAMLPPLAVKMATAITGASDPNVKPVCAEKPVPVVRYSGINCSGIKL